jgi:hypothetical protein
MLLSLDDPHRKVHGTSLAEAVFQENPIDTRKRFLVLRKITAINA